MPVARSRNRMRWACGATVPEPHMYALFFRVSGRRYWKDVTTAMAGENIDSVFDFSQHRCH